MAQKQLEYMRFSFHNKCETNVVANTSIENFEENVKKVNVGVQTENSPELFFNISKNKNVHLYYSKTKDMWKIFKSYYNLIDKEMSNKN